MTSLAFALIFVSAIIHALWNLIAKRVQGGTSFVWLFTALEVLILPPIVLIFSFEDLRYIQPIHVVFILGSGLLHIFYFLLLTNGYRVGDLSIVYPIARGLGPLLAVFGAIIFLQDVPTQLAFVGTVIISIGAIILTGDPRKVGSSNLLPGITYAILTAIAIASYTLWDAYAMNTIRISPLIFQFGISISRFVLLSPFVLGEKEAIRNDWKKHRLSALWIAILSPASYFLILIALQFTAVTYVAPLRTLSILFGVILGTNLLREGDSMRRIVAALIIVCGVILLNIG